MTATRRLVLLLGAIGVVASTAPVHADPLLAAPTGGTSSERAYGSGGVGFQAVEGSHPHTAASIDPLLALVVVLAVPAGTDPTSDSGNTIVKAAAKDPGHSGSGSGGGTTPVVSGSPEPGTLVTALIGAGVAGYAALRRRRASTARPLERAEAA